MTVWLAGVVAAGALLAIALALARLLRGPTAADRVVALDVMLAASIALVAAVALRGGRVLFLDIAVGVAATGFVATLAWARVVARASGERPP